jgi:hypothetical protein
VEVAVEVVGVVEHYQQLDNYHQGVHNLSDYN